MKFEKSILDNGIRVVTETHNWAKAVQVGFFIESGTKHEIEGQMGMAHLTEHMVFKGTKDKSALDIVLDLEKQGADINAHTSREYTCYTTTSLKEAVPLCLETLADLVFKSSFPANEFEREKNVVLQEIDMSVDQLEEYIFDLHFEMAFEKHPIARNILGTKESLAKITREDLLKYYNESYQNKNMIISMTGPMDHHEFIQILKDKKVDQLLKKESKVYPTLKDKDPLKYKSFNYWKSRPSEQTHLVIGFPNVSFLDPLRFESYVLSSYLGGGMTAKLYQLIREQKGWAYSVYSYLQSFVEGGSLSLYMGTSSDKVVPILNLVNEEIKNLLKTGISKEDLDLYKTQVKSSVLMGQDDLENRMNSIGVNEMIFHRYREVDEILEDIEKITVQSFNNLLPKCFVPDQIAVLALGETEDKTLKEFNNFKWSFL